MIFIDTLSVLLYLCKICRSVFWPVAKMNNLRSQLACEDASGYFDFSGSGMVCQVGLPSLVVARQQGIIQKVLVVSVEKGGEA